MRKKIFSIALLGFLSTLSAGVISQNGVAKDNATGLMWQDEPITEAEKTAYKNNTNNGKAGNWNYAKAYCENLTLGGYSDWRLPNIYELTTLIDNTKSSDPYVINGIENIASYNYCSSTAHASGSSYAWNVSFYFGNVFWNDKTYSYYVRCVRAGQLNFDNLVILKNKGKLKVSQKNIDEISPNAEKIEAKKIAERKKQEAERERQVEYDRSRTVQSYEVIRKIDLGKEGNKYLTQFDIKCSNGKTGYLNRFVPFDSTLPTNYCPNNSGCNDSVDEAVKSICGY